MKLLETTAVFLAVIFVLASPEALAAGTSATSAASATKADAEQYTIKFNRPLKVGDVYELALAISDSSECSAAVKGGEQATGDAAVLGTGSRKIELRGLVEVLAVDKDGWPDKVNFTVSQGFVSTTRSNWPYYPALFGEQGNIDIKPGTVVTIERKGRSSEDSLKEELEATSKEQQKRLSEGKKLPAHSTVVASKDPGQELSVGETRLLWWVVVYTPCVAPCSGGVCLDEVQGTSEKMIVGDSWETKPQPGLPAYPRCKGKATLKRVFRIDGADWLEIALESGTAPVPRTVRQKYTGMGTYFTTSQTILIPADPVTAGQYKCEGTKVEDFIFIRTDTDEGASITRQDLLSKSKLSVSFTMKKRNFHDHAREKAE
jgi:hypothetical protein